MAQEEPVRSEEYKGYTINIYQDIAPSNPRKEFDQLGTMVTWHPDYDLSDPNDFTKESALEYFTPKNKDIFYLPLYLLDHSGLRLSVGRYCCDPQGWDTSFIGWIYVTRATVKEEWGVKRIGPKLKALVIRNLHGEVAEMDQYLSGDVYGFSIEDPDGETIDSCWGFYGHEYVERDVIPECKSTIDHAIAKAEHFETYIQPILM